MMDPIQDVLDTLNNGELLERDSFSFSIDFTFNELPMRISMGQGGAFDVQILQTDRAATFTAEPGTPPRIDWHTLPDQDMQAAIDVIIALCVRMVALTTDAIAREDT